MPDLKECLKAHPVLHSVVGVGLGFLLSTLIPGFDGDFALTAGIILVIVGVVGELVFLPKKAD
jgi:hypothetical protein